MLCLVLCVASGLDTITRVNRRNRAARRRVRDGFFICVAFVDMKVEAIGDSQILLIASRRDFYCNKSRRCWDRRGGLRIFAKSAKSGVMGRKKQLTVDK